MILLAGICLIVLIVLAGLACRQVALGTREPAQHINARPRVLRRWAGYVALSLALAVLLLRPDEEIESGEDAGAYFNAALSFSSHQGLESADPALAELSPAERRLFRYGHAGFLLTKDAVLWARDPEWSRVGPHFFPAYSVLLGVPAALGFPYAAFWFAPVFALLIGGLLALVATWLVQDDRGSAIGHPWPAHDPPPRARLAGWLAFSLFMLNPAVVWNARCLRAEWPASFLALSGIVLWLAHTVMHKRMSPAQAFLGGLALAAAGWFHATAFYVMIPTVMASIWLTRRSIFWTAWWCGLVLGCGGVLAQVIWITDPYGLKNMWSDVARRNLLILAGTMGLTGMVGMRWTLKRLKMSRVATRIPGGRVVGGLVSLGCLLIILYSMRYRDDQGLIPGLPAWTASYISLTDFDGVRRIFSRVGFGVALAGIIALCVRSGTAGQLGRWLFLLLAPASLTIGWVVNYMFETRRMITFLVPFFVLASTTVLMMASAAMSGLIQRWRPKGSALSRMVEFGLPYLLTVMLLLVALRGRTQLYTTWNNRGTYRFYHTLASEIRDAGDFLLAEYTQTAAPLERLSGLPLLPIAWGYRSEAEYRQAEQVFERLVREHPERRYLLISPFSGAAVPGVQAEALLTRTLETFRLGRARRSIPMQGAPRRLTLHVQRLLPEGRTGEALPYTRVLNSGRLGLQGATKFMPDRKISLEGVALGANASEEVQVRLPAGHGGGRLFGIVAFPEPPTTEQDRLTDEQPIPLSSIAPDDRLTVGPLSALQGSIRRYALGTVWEGFNLVVDPGTGPIVTLKLQTSQTAYLATMFWEDASDGSIRPVQALALPTEYQISIDSQ